MRNSGGLRLAEEQRLTRVYKLSVRAETRLGAEGGRTIDMGQGRHLAGEVVSVNVGRPQLLEWRGQKVRTSIQKVPVHGRVMARHLDLDGDEQADLAGHGGENRAMLVYQLASYRFWQEMFGDDPYELGCFGENLTVEGLPDCEVCIGDRFRVGEALIEVTQPRVTCYRLAIRTGRPEMPSLFVKHGRPGFYVRVLEEGTIGARDRIELVGSAPPLMTVTATDRLLFFGEHPADDLKAALSISALSQGWKGSFQALLEAQQAGPIVGNPGLSRNEKEPWQGFRSLDVLSNEAESWGVCSIRLGLPEGEALPSFRPGQHVVLKLTTPEGNTLIRSYSLSGQPDGGSYRISIKREPGGAASGFLQDRLQPGTTVETSAPRGTFTLDETSTAPVVLLSAGIGATPLIAMLHALVHTKRKVFWIHGARDGSHLSFRIEVTALLASLTDSERLIAFSRPAPQDVQGTDYDVHGRLDLNTLAGLAIPPTAEYYICGPSGFLSCFRDELMRAGVNQARIHSESFRGAVAGKNEAPAILTGEKADFSITATRSNRVLSWSSDSGSLLELTEAEQIPVPFACRVGVCHRCESGLLAGNVTYEPQPLDPPPEGKVLLCCARPTSNLILDL